MWGPLKVLASTVNPSSARVVPFRCSECNPGRAEGPPQLACKGRKRRVASLGLGVPMECLGLEIQDSRFQVQDLGFNDRA